MNTRNPMERVRGISRCAKIHYRTRTHATRFGITVGLPVPILNPNPRHHRQFFAFGSVFCIDQSGARLVAGLSDHTVALWLNGMLP